MRRLLKTIALAGASYALWEYLRRRLGDEQPPQQGDSSAAAQAQPAKTTSSPKRATSGSSNGSGSKASKAELYERATKLEIKGRSKMSKAELERAIRDAS